MAEDDISDQWSPAVGLSTNDITPNVYEGGFKTWECAVDLAGYLFEILSEDWKLAGREVHVIEVVHAPSHLVLLCSFDIHEWFMIGGRWHSFSNARVLRLLPQTAVAIMACRSSISRRLQPVSPGKRYPT